MTQELTKDIIMEWDVVNWSRALPFWQAKTKLDLSKSKCLEIGARNGGLSLWLSQICKSVIYSDIDLPTEKCKELHAHYNPKNIEYKVVNATLPIELPTQDLIVTKSILGVQEGDVSKTIIANIYNNLRDGGEYWFVENLEGSWLHQILRKKFVPWGNRWTYLKVEEIQSTFAQFKEVDYQTLGFLGALGRSNRQRNILGTLDKLFLDKFFPQNMHYVIVGVARK